MWQMHAVTVIMIIMCNLVQFFIQMQIIKTLSVVKVKLLQWWNVKTWQRCEGFFKIFFNKGILRKERPLSRCHITTNNKKPESNKW